MKRLGTPFAFKNRPSVKRWLPKRESAALELVVHPNYVVILEQTLDTVTVIAVLHAAKKYL